MFRQLNLSYRTKTWQSGVAERDFHIRNFWGIAPSQPSIYGNFTSRVRSHGRSRNCIFYDGTIYQVWHRFVPVVLNLQLRQAQLLGVISYPMHSQWYWPKIISSSGDSFLNDSPKQSHIQEPCIAWWYHPFQSLCLTPHGHTHMHWDQIAWSYENADLKIQLVKWQDGML